MSGPGRAGKKLAEWNGQAASGHGGDATIQQLLRAYDEIHLELASHSAGKNSSTQFRFVTTDEVQKDLLDAETVLLSYWLVGDHGYCWVISKKNIRSFVVPGTQTFMDLVKALPVESVSTGGPQTIQGGKPWDEALKALGRILVKPAEPEIRGKRVVILPDGPLRFVPFSALLVKGLNGTTVPLVVNGPVVMSPSCAAAGLRVGRRPAVKCVKGGAEAVFVSDGKVYKIDDAAKVQDHVGHKVTITGEVKGDTIQVQEVKM